MGPAWLSADIRRKKKKKMSSRGSLEAESGGELRASLREMLECPVCYELLRPPILQCLNGHILCSNCTARLKGSPCPVCRGKMESSRNLVAEELCHKIWYPCRHKLCAQSYMLRDLDDHEATCDRQYCCPLITSWCSDGSVRLCSWTLPRSEALCHAMQHHGTHVWRGRKHHVIDYNFTDPLQRLYLVSAYEELFLWCGQYRPLEQKFYGALKLEGSVIETEQYTYALKLSKCLGRETLEVACIVHGESFEDVFQSGFCVILDLHTIQQFSEGDRVSFILKIDKKK